MMGKEALFQEFLAEVQALDDFRHEYKQRYDFEELGRDDQDVQRLMEAMAFYCARTRGGAEQAMRRYELRALEQLFPHLLSPLPAMGLLYPVLGSNMTEARCLPDLAEVVVAPGRGELTEAGASDERAQARTFRSVSAISIFPLHVVEGSVSLQPKSVADAADGAAGVTQRRAAGHTLRLELAGSARPQKKSGRHFADVKQPLKELVLYLNPQGDLLLALRIHDAIVQSCQHVTAHFFSEGSLRASLPPRKLAFGMRPPEVKQGWENPIEHARRLIHFPLAEMCIRIPLASAPAEWSSVALELELDEQWPAGLVVSDRTFLLNAGPIENLVRRTAQPIDSDGTRMRYRVDYQEPKTGLQVREVLGVYLADPAVAGARTTLLPSASCGAGYTVESEGRGIERETWLETDEVLGSVGKPERLYVDAEWYLPEARLPNAREASVSVEGYDFGDLRWHVSDPLRAPAESLLAGDPKALAQLLDLHDRRIRSAADVQFLLRVLGVEGNEVLSRVPRHITRLESAFSPDSRMASGGVRSYDLTLSKLPPVLIPAARLLFRLLPGVLGTWTGDSDVRVSVTFDAALPAAPSVFEWRASHDG